MLDALIRQGLLVSPTLSFQTRAASSQEGKGTSTSLTSSLMVCVEAVCQTGRVEMSGITFLSLDLTCRVNASFQADRLRILGPDHPLWQVLWVEVPFQQGQVK